MKRALALIASLAAGAALAGCGADEEGAGEKAATGPTTPTGTRPAAPPKSEQVRGDAVLRCLKGAGLKVQENPEQLEGLQDPTESLKVKIGEGDFDDPSDPGGFGFYGHAFVFKDATGARRSGEGLSRDRFTDGEVVGNVYAGYNTDLAKLPKVERAADFRRCVRG